MTTTFLDGPNDLITAERNSVDRLSRNLHRPVAPSLKSSPIAALGHTSPRRIVIFRALKLGKMLCAVPAFRSIRTAFPEAEVVLVGLPWSREFVARYGALLDGFREFPGYPGLPEREPETARIAEFFAGLQSEQFDLAIQLHASGTVSNEVVSQFGATVNAGFYEQGTECPDSTTFVPFPERGLELRRLLRLLEHLGVPSCGESLEFPIRADDRRQARQLMQLHGLSPRSYVCMNMEASAPERCWPAERFVAVANALAARGFPIVLTGTKREAERAAALCRVIRGTAISVAGGTDLGTLAALLSKASLLVCNDTGVSHLADALEVPSVVVSMGNNPDRWAPIDWRLHRVLCHNLGVAADEVIVHALDLLTERSRRPAHSPTHSGSGTALAG